MSRKRKLDELIDSFSNVNISSTQSQAKRPITLLNVSKIELKPHATLIKIHNYKQKNIFGLDPIPEQETFTKEEVQILLDQRERVLYKRYLQLLKEHDKPERLIKQLQSVL